MKPILLYRWVISAALLGVLTAQAGPLQRKDIPASPAWVLHVDCERLRPTAVGKWILSELEKPDAQDKLAGLQAMLDFDPRRQLHAVTFYSASSDSQDGILVAYADFNSERLTTMAKAAQDHQSVPHGRYVIHDWVDEKKKPKDGVQPRTYAAISGKRVIFGQRRAAVAAALDVVDGRAATLARSSDLPQLGKSGSTSFLQAAARKLELSANAANAAIFRLAKLLQLDISESDEQVNATLILEANSENVAKQMSAVLQGVLALLKLQTDKPEARLAEAVSLKQEADRVVASLGVRAPDVINVVQAGMAKKAQKKDP